MTTDDHDHDAPSVPLSGVWLLRAGDKVVVLVRREGRWYEAIREPADAHYSHEITGWGLQALDDRDLLQLLEEPAVTVGEGAP